MIEQRKIIIAKYKVENSNSLFDIFISKIEVSYKDKFSIAYQGDVLGFLMTNASPNFEFLHESYVGETEKDMLTKCVEFLNLKTPYLKTTRVEI
jgi:hypothetical protein